jgi:hypothetical protein
LRRTSFSGRPTVRKQRPQPVSMRDGRARSILIFTCHRPRRKLSLHNTAAVCDLDHSFVFTSRWAALTPALGHPPTRLDHTPVAAALALAPPRLLRRACVQFVLRHCGSLPCSGRMSLVQTAAQLPIPTSGPWKLFLFDDANTNGAVCLDGSPAGFYYRWADSPAGAH